MCDNHLKGKPSVSNLTVGNKVDVPKCIGKKKLPLTIGEPITWKNQLLWSQRFSENILSSM